MSNRKRSRAITVRSAYHDGLFLARRGVRGGQVVGCGGRLRIWRRDGHVTVGETGSGPAHVRSICAPHHFHYTPTSASWLNQVEGFFGILGKQSLGVTNFDSKRALRDHLHAFMRSWNSNPTPFAWTKPATAIIRSHRRMLDRISTAVH